MNEIKDKYIAKMVDSKDEFVVMNDIQMNRWIECVQQSIVSWIDR